jgi:hypothetical protein
MTPRILTLTLRGTAPEPLDRICCAQVDDGPEVRLSPADMENILYIAAVMAGEALTMTPVPGTDGEELSVQVPLEYPLNTYLPQECLASTRGDSQILPGQIGALCMTVGGADALATMMGVTTADIQEWANHGIPDGPAKILLVRFGEDFGMDLSHTPTAKMMSVASPVVLS